MMHAMVLLTSILLDDMSPYTKCVPGVYIFYRASFGESIFTTTGHTSTPSHDVMSSLTL